MKRNGTHCCLVIFAAITFLAALTSPATLAQSPAGPPSFESLPFKSWLDGKNVTQLPWTLKITSNGLSKYQRMEAGILAFVWVEQQDVGGSLLCVTRITDSHGKSYEVSGTFPVRPPTADHALEVELGFGAYLLPGEYDVAVAVYSTLSHKRDVGHQALHVAPISNDPLPAAWSNLPPVEVFRWVSPPGLVNSRLQLSLNPKRPVQLEILANLTPTYALKPTTFLYRRNLYELFPALMVLSQISVSNGSLNLTALELDNQRIAFEQDGVGLLDWHHLWQALLAHNSNVLDAKALSAQLHEANFFTSEVRKRLSADGPAPDAHGLAPRRVIVVLSDKMAFPKGEDLSPISAANGCDCQVFYIRTHFMQDMSTGNFLMSTHPANHPEEAPGPPATVPPDTDIGGPINFPPLHKNSTKISDVDQLERTLAPLHPRLFDVKSPGDFRKALSAILAEAGNS